MPNALRNQDPRRRTTNTYHVSSRRADEDLAVGCMGFMFVIWVASALLSLALVGVIIWGIIQIVQHTTAG